MRITKAAVSLALVVDAAVAKTWFSKAAYNKWHETELERWLSDHDIPYPAPADRKDLENLVQKNWNYYVLSPYENWDTASLASFLKGKGVETKESDGSNKDSLIAQVKNLWYESEDKTDTAYTNVKDWILDTWTESQLKAFCDKHAIPVPQPRNRDTLLQKARSSYETVAKKAGSAASYPGNWLYESWTESALKEWLDARGFPVPQPTTRDKLIASVRRNSRLAYLRAQEQSTTASSSAQAAYATLTDKLIDAWSESQLKDFADRNGITVPQGTKTNQLRALVHKHRAKVLGDTLSHSFASAKSAATSNVAQAASEAAEETSKAAQDAFNEAVNTWSESRLKSYLDARGVPLPHGTKTDELRALVRKNAHKAASGWRAWNWDDVSFENLKAYLVFSGSTAAKKTAERTDATRGDLIEAAQSAYASASSVGGAGYTSATSYLTQATDSAKKSTFDAWSGSELKAYLDSYGIPVPQQSTLDELRAAARKQSNYFKYGTTTPTETIFSKIGENAKAAWNYVASHLNAGAEVAQKKAADAADKVREEL